MNRFAFAKSPVLWLVVSLVAAGSMGFYVAEIWSANQPRQFSDLYAPWWAAHELFLHGRNPYSPQVAHEIQTVIYGAPTEPSADDPDAIGGGFAYPPYAALMLWPTLHVSFSAAQKIFLSVSTLLTLLSLVLWAHAIRLRRSPLQWLTLAFFLLGSFPAMQAFKLQNLSVIAAALLAIAFFFLSRDRFGIAGICFALSTFKPQFMVALVPWLALWMVADWRRRRPLAWSFLATILPLVLVSEWLVPGWLPSFLKVIRAYRHYTYGHSLLDVWLTPQVGIFASAALLVAAVCLCWPYRSESADSAKFTLTVSLILAATVVLIPTLAPHAQLLLLPGFLCLMRHRTEKATNRAAAMTRLAAWFLLAWPWLAAFGLLLARIRLPVAALQRYWEVPLYTSPVLPLAVMFAMAAILRSRPA